MNRIHLFIWFALLGVTLAALPTQVLPADDYLPTEMPEKSGSEDLEETEWNEGLKVFSEKICYFPAPFSFGEAIKTFHHSPILAKVSVPPTPPPEHRC